MTISWYEASHSVISSAQELINDHHRDLNDARICFVYRSEAAISNGREVNAGVQLVQAKLQPFLEYDFLIWVAKDFWENAPNIKTNAALDHVLYHCSRDGEGRWYIRPHDVEDFIECIQRHGMPNNPWAEKALAEAVQSRLPLDIESRGKLGSLSGEQIKKVNVEVKSFGDQNLDEMVEDMANKATERAAGTKSRLYNLAEKIMAMPVKEREATLDYLAKLNEVNG